MEDPLSSKISRSSKGKWLLKIRKREGLKLHQQWQSAWYPARCYQTDAGKMLECLKLFRYNPDRTILQVRQVQVKNKFRFRMFKAMQAKLEPYHGSGKKVVVYNTYADKGRLHFDVFIPTDKSQPTQVSKDIDTKAVEHAKEFLRLIGRPSDDVAVNMCERCHIDNTDLYANELWQLPGKEIFIWPMEGCPKPS